MIAPPDSAIAAAISYARKSPCAKSKRGAAVFYERSYGPPERRIVIAGTGFNGPPEGVACDGSDACRAHCRVRCQHAEARSVHESLHLESLSDCELVHVKVVDGKLVSGGGPSCVACSGLLLDVKIGGVWLYETTPEEWCPHLDMLCTECPLCQGEDCDVCHPGIGRPHCDHDVLDRHHGHPVVEARWRRYTAADFHRISCRTSKVY